jgi:hypothetical protein
MGKVQTSKRSSSDATKNDDIFPVEKLLKKRSRKGFYRRNNLNLFFFLISTFFTGKVEYLIKWKDYSE